MLSCILYVGDKIKKAEIFYAFIINAQLLSLRCQAGPDILKTIQYSNHKFYKSININSCI